MWRLLRVLPVIVVLSLSQVFVSPAFANPSSCAALIRPKRDVRIAFQGLRNHMAVKVLGQGTLIQTILMAILVNGHILLESPPGLAKTTTIKTLASGTDGKFSRISGRSDLMPSDINGFIIVQNGKKIFVPGAIFGNFILFDEINRVQPKTLSALLEPMEEKKVTIGRKSRELPDVYLVLATRNPHDNNGTFEMPQASEDRFLIFTSLDYSIPRIEAEVAELVHKQKLGEVAELSSAERLTIAEIREARKSVLQVNLSKEINLYVAELVALTRPNTPYFLQSLSSVVASGAGPRATIGITELARAYAWLDGRNQVEIADVNAVAPLVLRHRIALTEMAKFDGRSVDKVIEMIIQEMTDRK